MTKTIHNQSTNKSQSEILQLHLNKECVRKFLFLAPGLEPSSFSSASSFLAIKFLAGICISLLDQFFLMSCNQPLTIYLLSWSLANGIFSTGAFDVRVAQEPPDSHVRAATLRMRRTDFLWSERRRQATRSGRQECRWCRQTIESRGRRRRSRKR